MAPEGTHLNHNSNRLSDDDEKVAAVYDVETMDLGSGLEVDDSSNVYHMHQEAARSALVELPTNQHEDDHRLPSSMDIEIRNIAKANLKRIDPKIRIKKTDSDGDARPPDERDVMEPGSSFNKEGVELTQSERDMQVDIGGAVSSHPL